MALTEVGKFIRKLRLENGEILKNMAEKLEVSSAFLSAVENGKKKLPQTMKNKIINLYNLTEVEKNEFERSIIETESVIAINLNNFSAEKREFTLALARKLENINEIELKKWQRMLKKEEEDDGI